MVAAGLTTKEALAEGRVISKNEFDSVLSKFMAEPVTSKEKLFETRDDMKSRMEMMIMEIQVVNLNLHGVQLAFDRNVMAS